MTSAENDRGGDPASGPSEGSGVPEPSSLSGAGPLEPPDPTVDQRVRLAELLGAVEDVEEVLILTHDNPDPDAIASAAALSHLLEAEGGKETTLGFGGIVGRAENRALIGELGVQFRRMRPAELPTGRAIALVDTQPRTGNNAVPPGRIVSIVVDHHPVRPETGASTFVDVRPEYGASCSILVEYLRAAGIEPPRPLATALFYGVQSETMDLGREASSADVAASLYLYPRSDPGSIARIRHARVPQSYLGSIHSALERARRIGGFVWIPAGRLDYPDMVAELADLFMRVEGIRWTVAAGRYEDDLLLSVRCAEPDAHAGRLIREVVGDRGSAGGHGMLAGAQLPLGDRSDAEVEALQEELSGDLKVRLGEEDSEEVPIIDPDGTEEGSA